MKLRAGKIIEIFEVAGTTEEATPVDGENKVETKEKKPAETKEKKPAETKKDPAKK